MSCCLAVCELLTLDHCVRISSQLPFCTMAPKHLTVEKYFQYKPSLALNTVALVLFFLVTVVIAIQNVKYRSRFMWLVVFTGCLEVAGYICHLVATVSVNLTAYICNLVFIIMAPNFLALANYVCVGKVAEQLQLSGTQGTLYIIFLQQSCNSCNSRCSSTHVFMRAKCWCLHWTFLV